MAVALLTGGVLGAPARAEMAGPGQLPPGLAGAEILPGWRTPDGDYIAALKIELDAGWKTYWRVPGDAGIPPVLNFAASDNLNDVTVIWPAPQVFDQNGMRSVGYRDEMILPLRIRPKDATAPVVLEAGVEFGICHNICIPVELDLAADLSGPGMPDAGIERAMAAVPVAHPGLARCETEEIRDGMRVTARIDLPPDFAQTGDEIALFELRSTPMWISEPQMQRDGTQILARADFVPADARPFAIDRSDLRITVLHAGGAIQIDGCPE